MMVHNAGMSTPHAQPLQQPVRSERWLLAGIVLVGLVVSGVIAKDRLTWALEVIWAMVGLALVAWKEQNLLMADRPARTFGFKRDFASQLADARRWQGQAPAVRWILAEDVVQDGCIDASRAIDMGVYNRRRWWLVPANAMRNGCVPADPSAAGSESE